MIDQARNAAEQLRSTSLTERLAELEILQARIRDDQEMLVERIMADGMIAPPKRSVTAMRATARGKPVQGTVNSVQ